MSRRPNYLNITRANDDSSKPLVSPRLPMHLDLPSPRAGEIPPALSPLDAFALQSRMLAKKFEESQQKGRRISRLDHREIANELARRPGYFRSISGGSQQSRQTSGDESDRGYPTPPIEPAQQVIPRDERPVSHYPKFSNTSDKDGNRNTVLGERWFDAQENGIPEEPIEEPSYFGIQMPRASSPEPVDRQAAKAQDSSPVMPSLTSSVDSVQSSTLRTDTGDSQASQRHEQGLAPPRSPYQQRSNRSVVSIRSVVNSADDEGPSINDLAPPRKFSNDSAFSRPRSPMTPDGHRSGHSPATSEHSITNGHFQRPSLNFSRPLSSSSNKAFLDGRPTLSSRPSYETRPSFEFPARQSSLDQGQSPLRKTSISSVDSEGRTPRLLPYEPDQDPNMSGEEDSATSAEAQRSGASSYIYSKYSLPRGRVIERGSLGKRDTWAKHQFKWEEPAQPDQPAVLSRPTMTPDQSPNLSTPQRPGPNRSHTDGPFVMASPRIPETRRSRPSSPALTSRSTERTIRDHTRNSPSADIINLSPEQHLEKGIECHSSGSLSKSTYHLRLAARAGLPTAMLLYALACRHGWGMRPNQAEGVMWLKRAVDSSSLELLADGSAASGPTLQSHSSGTADSKRNAQFALAIYELGMSYQHGWGISKDKSLALRCFEIAGSWGDYDALAEAGFCYAQGLGCKKDLKKAAGFYRRAAEGGISVAGNSWIYKPKYMDEPAATPAAATTPVADKTAKPPRSRARTLFGRRKPDISM